MASWPAEVAARLPASPSGLGWPASRQCAPSSLLRYTHLVVCPVYPWPVHKMARSVAEITATDGVCSGGGHGTRCRVRPGGPGRMTITSLPTTAAATPAWVAIRSSGSSSLVAAPLAATTVQLPPLSGRRARKPSRRQPLACVHRAPSTRTCPGTTATDSTTPDGARTRPHRWPPSVVSHSPSPNTNPCPGVAKRMPHTAPACPGAPTGTGGAGRAVQLTPRFRVRAIEVHGASAHGAVPSTNASSGDTQVTDVAANPAGTGPPRALTVGPAEGPADGEELDTERTGVLAPGLADPAAADSRTVLHP